MTIGGCLAFFYNVVHDIFINVTSSVYSTVAGNFKVILVIVVSIVFLQHRSNPSELRRHLSDDAFLTFGFYSYLSFKEKSKANAAAASQQPDAEATQRTPLKK